MTPSHYVQQQLDMLSAPLPVPVIESGIEEKIYTLLLSKKFRKYAVNPEYVEHIRSAIALNVSRGLPIKLTLVFGGYKLWRLPEAPEPDWAEVFSLIYYTNWLRPIAAIYKPGVIMDFYSDDVILEYMDNIPKSETEQYIAGFRNVLEFMKSYIPNNISFTLNRVGDQYRSYKDFIIELEQSIEDVKKTFGGLPTLTPEQAKLVELNVRVKPGQTDDPKWKEKVFLIHEGYARVSKRRPYYRCPDKIFVITRPLKDSIAVGTTKTSVVKFWIGVGVLKKQGDSFVPHVYSPKQLSEGNFSIENIHVDGLTGKNYTSMRVFS